MSEQEILISGGMVELRTVQVSKRMPLSLFEEGLRSSFAAVTPMLPYGTVLYGIQRENTYYVMGFKPSEHILTYRDYMMRRRRNRDEDDDEEEREEVATYRLKFPWMYFFFEFHRLSLAKASVYFAKDELRSPNDTLYHVPLPNIYNTGHICLGRGNEFNIADPVAVKVMRAIEHFWISEFNHDLANYMKSKLPESFWERVFENFECEESDLQYYRDHRNDAFDYVESEFGTSLWLEVWEYMCKEPAFNPCLIEWKEHGSFKSLISDYIDQGGEQ